VSGPQILVVDDDSQIRRALRVTLTGHGYEVRLAASGEEGLDRAATVPPDAVILDLVLPDLNGVEICRQLRQWSQVPIIVLSAKGDERDKVEALDVGADDYLTKPFGTDELLARIRAVLRRAPGVPTTPELTCGDLKLDQTRRLVTLRGEEVRLTPTQYEILCYLMANAGKVVTHRAVLGAVWGTGYEDAGPMLRVFIAQLRRKIEPNPSRPTFIRTESGIGYRFRAEP
jgi:two-component system, OmpR family, KDP operon response regulator KdpE